MKKVIALCLAIIMCCGLMGCGGKSKNTYTLDDLGLYDTKTRQTIRITDEKEYIEKITGSEKETGGLTANDGRHWADYDNELTVQYDKNNIVHSLAVSWRHWNDENKDDFHRYETPRALTNKSVVTDFFEKYPEAIELKYTSSGGYESTLFLKKEGEAYTPIEIRNLDESKEIDYKKQEKQGIYYTDTEYQGEFAGINIMYEDYNEINFIEIFLSDTLYILGKSVESKQK